MATSWSSRGNSSDSSESGSSNVSSELEDSDDGELSSIVTLLQQPKKSIATTVTATVLGTTNMADDDAESSPPPPQQPAQPPENPKSEDLWPCAVCGRKFIERSLEKHVRICERTAAKKRKPFDSAKQRVRGTELEEFLPAATTVNNHNTSGTRAAHGEERATKKQTNQWRLSRDEFLKSIRAARGDSSQLSLSSTHSSNNHHHSTATKQQRPSTLSLVASAGAPTRPNEKGQCPTCQRMFGTKAYERHVEFCRERATRLPASPQVGSSVAKERLEARMRYRAPALRNRKPTNKEKYSHAGAKSAVAQSPLMARATLVTKSCEVAASPNLPMLKRPGLQSKESAAVSNGGGSNGPLKSRPIDRSNGTPALRQLFTTRRLLLSDLLPSKILQNSTSSSQKSARAITPVDVATVKDSSEKKPKRKLKFKFRASKVSKTVVESVEIDEERTFHTWQQMSEEQQIAQPTIDKEEEPVMSDFTNMSSDENRYTTDEFEYNERMVSCEDKAEDAKKEDSDSDKTLVQNSDDDDDDDLSGASTKTFRKSDREHLLDLVHNFEIRDDDDDKRESLENVVEEEEVESCCLTSDAKMKERLSGPNKYSSLPNIASLNAIGKTPRERRGVEESLRRVEECYPKETMIDLREIGHASAETQTTHRRARSYSTSDESRPSSASEMCHHRRRKQQHRSKTASDPVTLDDRLSKKRRDKIPENTITKIDYYKNDSYTDLSTENESNASELLREIDACMIDSDLHASMNPCFASEESLLDVVTSRMRGVRLTNETSKCSRRKEMEATVGELPEITTRSRHLFNKELCSTTKRLDNVDRGETNFLPSIANPSNSGSRHCFDREHRREKLIRSHRRLRGIAELDEDEMMLRDAIDGDGDGDKRNRAKYARRSHAERRSGADKEYDPFLLAAQQFDDLFSDTSDQSSIDGSSHRIPQKPNSSPNFPTSFATSAFAKFPNHSNNSTQMQQSLQPQQQQKATTPDKPPQRQSVIAPPTGFDDLTSSDMSSDCADSISREMLSSSSVASSRTTTNGEHVLGRRIIIDPNQALGGGEFAPDNKMANGSATLNSRLARPMANRSNSSRAASAPKPPERKISSSSSSASSDYVRNNKLNGSSNGLAKARENSNKLLNGDSNGDQQQRGSNNYKNLNGSNLSLNSIISSTDLEMKRSNFLLDDLLSSFEDEINNSTSSTTLPTLMSLMRSEPINVSSSLCSSTSQHTNGVNGHHCGNNQKNGVNGGSRLNCSDDDAELSSPESVKRQECGKISADSAYNSLNRKYSNQHGRSANDLTFNKYKLSKFCHECGFRFPDSAKFCCECGVKRLTL